MTCAPARGVVSLLTDSPPPNKIGAMSTTLEKLSPLVISLYRIAIGLIFMLYGTGALLGWPAPEHAPELFAWPGWWAAVIQLVGGALLVLGLFTRSAAFVSAGSMAVAYFWMHQPDGLTPQENGGVASALLCWALFLLVFIGAGTISIDRILTQKHRDVTVEA